MAFEMFGDIYPEIDVCRKYKYCSEGEACRIAVCRESTAKQHSGTDSDIPTGKVGSIGCCPARIGCHIDEECVKGREYCSEAVTDEERREEIEHVAELYAPPGRHGERGFESCADDGYRYAFGYSLCHKPTVDHLARYQTGDDEPGGLHGKEEAGTVHYTYLGCIYGHIARCHSIGDCEHKECQGGRDALDKQETVERHKRAAALNGRAFLDLQQQREAEADKGCNESRCKKQGVVAVGYDKKTCHRTEGHCKVIGDAEIAESLAASRGGHYVDDKGVAGSVQRSEGETVEHTQEYELPQVAVDEQVAREEEGEEYVRYEIDPFALEEVGNKAGKGSYAEHCYDIAREYKPDNIALNSILVDKIERQSGDEQKEGEGCKEVGCTDEYVATREKSLLNATGYHRISTLEMERDQLE